MKATARDCIGCRDDFYNGKNPYGIPECWMLKDAEIVTRFRLSIDTPMNQRRGYAEVRVPKCYRKKGYVHVDQIPGYAK